MTSHGGLATLFFPVNEKFGGGRAGREGPIFSSAEGVSPPRATKNFFTSFNDATSRGIYATVRTLRLRVSSSTFGFNFCQNRICICCVSPKQSVCVLRGIRAAARAVGSRVATARRPESRYRTAVAINTRCTSAPVDFGQSFAGESVSGEWRAASERRRGRGRGRGGRRSALCGRGGQGLKPPKDKTYK